MIENKLQGQGEIDLGECFVTQGKHIGKPITQVPIIYLHQLIEQQCEGHEYASMEIERRGTKHSNFVDITYHAIDRASMQLMDIYRATRLPNEGLYTWLGRQAESAMKHGRTVGNRIVDHRNIRWVFSFEYTPPKLVTVMRNRPLEGQRRRENKGKKPRRNK